ncbi:MAG: CCA tRNA nucleotidyltransferase [Candidatus Bathyarchaeota archaeon]|nr:CCA tRNA nucleotidyltransferase [Candidatus Bathyarchaeota archaeon]
MHEENLNLKIRKVCEEALQRAIPSEEERRETLGFSEKLAERLERELTEAGLEAEVQVEGSIAKDTWLAGEKDIDLFILVPQKYGREAFAAVLNVAKKVAGENFLEAYAEHPYIQAEITGFTVDFVPCFKLKSAEDVVSSVDRTPFHTLYMKGQLTQKTKDEVRLLKRFMRGIDTYGAEIKVGGFSGYLCETLILNYGFFPELLQAAANWRERQLVDLKGYYKGREEEARKIFQEPLIVVDPVDKGRNVASAVRADKLNEFIAASREFLKKPSIAFFYPRKVEAFSLDELARKMDLRRSTLIFLKTGAVRAVPDVLWGQLYKSQRALRKMMCRQGFTVIRDAVWSDEESANVFMFELHSRLLPAVERHLGPPIEKKKDCEKFLEKHLRSKRILSGPRIEGNRWVVERKRKHTNIIDLLREHSTNGGENIGVASLISQAFMSSFKIWVNHEVTKFCSANHSFATFLTKYLRGTPRWL